MCNGKREDVTSAIDLGGKIIRMNFHCGQVHVNVLLLLQPSSAAAERVFSILSNSLNSQQESSLEDYTELSVILQYNNCSSH